MKFFRKHNRKLLAVFMALLMIVFVGGSALENWLRPDRNIVVAETRHGPITTQDQLEAASTTNLLNGMGLAWQRPAPGATEPLTELEWILLSRETKVLQKRDDYLSARSIMGEPAMAEKVEAVARGFRIRTDRVLDAVGQYLAVAESTRAITIATLPSETEIRSAARQALERVKVRAVVLPAIAFFDAAVQFTEEQIQTHFQKYRDREAGKGLDFGYRVPPSVRVQYIKIDRNRIMESIGVANIESKAKKYFQEQRERNPDFRRPAPAEPVEPTPPSPFMEWEEAKEIAYRAVRELEANEFASKVANWLVTHLSEPWNDSERAEDGYRTVPETAKDLGHYQEGIGRIPKSLTFPQAISVVVTDMVTATQATSLSDIGQAVFRGDRGAAYSLGGLAFRTKGLVPKVPDDKGVNREDYLAPFQTCPYALKDMKNNNLYLFRTIDTRDAHPPDSVEEVRDDVLRDLRMIRGFERALIRAEGVRNCEPGLDLKAAFEHDDELVSFFVGGMYAGQGGWIEPPPFPRLEPRQAAGGGKTASTFIRGGMGYVPMDVVDLCFALGERVERTAVVELPERPAAMVIEWVETLPPTEGEFQQIRQKMVDDMVATRTRLAVAEWLSPEKIQARNQFKLQGARKK